MRVTLFGQHVGLESLCDIERCPAPLIVGKDAHMPLSGVGTYITRSRRTVTITSCIILFAVGLAKLFIVRILLRMGTPREFLQAQDAIITGALAAGLVWVLLIAVRARREQEQRQIRVVADLNHHLR